MEQQRPLAGGIETLRSITWSQRQNAHGRAVSLFRMRPVAHHALDQDGGVEADPGRPANQASRRGVGVALMRLGVCSLTVTWPERCERRTWQATRW